jgi:hypothetical protein
VCVLVVLSVVVVDGGVVASVGVDVVDVFVVVVVAVVTVMVLVMEEMVV